MITLITARIRSRQPDIQLLKKLELGFKRYSTWKTRPGPILFAPRALSSRWYTLIHYLLKPVLKSYKIKGAVLSLGLPYRFYFFSKTFPYFSRDADMRVLWTYDVWQPDYPRVEKLVREGKINLLLLSSHQATEHFYKLKIPGCTVDWVPETINVEEYKYKPWNRRSIHVLSFGRGWQKYHDQIVEGCRENKINYLSQHRSEDHDVAVHGLKKNLLFPGWTDFVNALADTQICICFPRSVTHPGLAGNVSTLTIRYLQAMASKCLILGTAPLDIAYLLNYNPVIEVDWSDPVGQIRNILDQPAQWQALVERNYLTVSRMFQYNNAVDQIDRLIKSQLEINEMSLTVNAFKYNSI